MCSCKCQLSCAHGFTKLDVELIEQFPSLVKIGEVGATSSGRVSPSIVIIGGWLGKQAYRSMNPCTSRLAADCARAFVEIDQEKTHSNHDFWGETRRILPATLVVLAAVVCVPCVN